ncbi:hypothetical protein TNCV_2284971 [Trichonephila clavipes]|nr:hypothetical protein TNCV_2284971 [Trichonephila clavipes]
MERVEDGQRSGCPQLSRATENIEKDFAEARKNRLQTTTGIFPELVHHFQALRFQFADEIKSASQAELKDMVKMNSRSISKAFTSDAKNVFWLNGLISKEDVFQ